VSNYEINETVSLIRGIIPDLTTGTEKRHATPLSIYPV
jgi:hypothetical protein